MIQPAAHSSQYNRRHLTNVSTYPARQKEDETTNVIDVACATEGYPCSDVGVVNQALGHLCMTFSADC